MQSFKLIKPISLTVLAFTFLIFAGGCSSSDHKKDSDQRMEEGKERNDFSSAQSTNSAETQIAKNAPLLTHPELSVFAEGVKAADVGDLFQGTGPFTAFIPSNEAIDKFGQNKWKNLLKPENKDELTSILIYHIVPGKYMSKSLKTMTLKTINGKNIEIQVENGQIKVNNAKVIRTDMVGPNGVVHEIDTVLVP